MKKNRKITFLRIFVFAAFLLLWQVAADKQWIDSFYFSSPLLLYQQFIHDMTDMSLFRHCFFTLSEFFISFILIIGGSIFLAALFWFFQTLGKVMEPFLIILNSLPKSALAPLIIVWLGTGIKPIILCGISVGIFGSVLHFYQSFCNTDPERIKLIRTLGGNKVHIFTKVVFPGNIPLILSMSKVNIGLALVGVIIGEFLAGRQGIGYLIIYSSQTFKMTIMIMSICILCLLSALLYLVVNQVERFILNKKY